MSSVLARNGNRLHAWRAQTVDSDASWYYRLSDDCLGALSRFAERADAGADIAQLPVDTDELAACQDCLAAVRDALLLGRGFAIVHQLPADTVSQKGLIAIYWALGHLLGTPQVQDKHGTLLFDVTDTGQDVKQGARFSGNQRRERLSYRLRFQSGYAAGGRSPLLEDGEIGRAQSAGERVYRPRRAR